MISPASTLQAAPGVPALDRSHEVATWPAGAPLPGPDWRADSLDPGDCLVHVGARATEILLGIAQRLAAAPLPTLLRATTAAESDALAPLLRALRQRLRVAPGVAVLDRLPMDALDLPAARDLFWMLGQHMGRTVAQKWDGTLLYDVQDTGQRYAYGVRGSRTNVELVFHTDNAFAVAPPSVVGLLCVWPALRGGVSRFCSLAAVHNRLAASEPELLARLYQPMYWDRQGEHAPGAPRVLWAPMFRHEDGTLRSRANVSLVRKGYEVAGVTPDTALVEALVALETLTGEPQLWLEMAIERGQLQYLDNVNTAHYRSTFEDDPAPERRRHLIRTWHRDTGERSYDG